MVTHIWIWGEDRRGAPHKPAGPRHGGSATTCPSPRPEGAQVGSLGCQPIWLHTSSCCPRPLVLPGQGRNLGCAGGRSRSPWVLEAHRRCAPDILPDKPPRPAFQGDGEAARAVAASC